MPGESVALDDGSTATVWTEDLRLEGGEALVRYVDGPVPGRPAVTRNGNATYVATRLDDEATGRLLAGVCEEAGVRPALEGLPAGVEAVRRRGEHDYLFLLNHGSEPVTVPVSGVDLLSGRDGAVELEPFGVAVVRHAG
jgi:beta-galactosidase